MASPPSSLGLSKTWVTPFACLLAGPSVESKATGVPLRAKTHPSGSNSWNRFSSASPRFISKKHLKERSKGFGQQARQTEANKSENSCDPAVESGVIEVYNDIDQVYILGCATGN